MRRITLQDKRVYLEQTPAYCRAQAEQQLGPEVGRYMERILADHAMRNVRKAQAGAAPRPTLREPPPWTRPVTEL